MFRVQGSVAGGAPEAEVHTFCHTGGVRNLGYEFVSLGFRV